MPRPEVFPNLENLRRIVPLLLISALAPNAFGDLSIVQGNVVDLGATTVGRALKGRIEVKNAGTEKVLLQRISVSCGCSATESKRENLNPGETTEIHVSFEKRALPARMSSDIIVEGISSSGQKMNVKTNVSGHYTAPFLVSPSPLILTLPASPLTDREVSLQLRDIDPRISSIQIEGDPKYAEPMQAWSRESHAQDWPAFRVKTRNLFQGANRLNIRLVGKAADGTFIGELSLPATAFLSGDVEATPSQIMFLGKNSSSGTQPEIRLSSRAGKEIQLVRVYSDTSWLECRVEETAGDKTKKRVLLDFKSSQVTGLGQVYMEYLEENRVCTLRVPVVRTAR